MIDRHSIEQVVDRVDIVDIVSRYVDLKSQGSNYVACCPFHNERTPSFVVNPSRNTWHCFGACNEGGDAISFVMHYCHLNFPEAVRVLAKMVGVQLDETEEKGKTAEQKMNELERESMFAAYRSLQPFFVEQLEGGSGESHQAKAYATKRWNADFVRETGIGYAPRDSRALIDFAKRHNIPENILLELGILRKSEKNGRLYAFFRERIMIPIRDRFSRIIGYTARYIGDSPDTAKYLNSATSLIYSKESSIFGIYIALRTAAKENKFYLVEGAPDVLRLQQIGANNVIASHSVQRGPRGSCPKSNDTRQTCAFCPMPTHPSRARVWHRHCLGHQEWSVGIQVGLQRHCQGDTPCRERRQKRPRQFLPQSCHRQRH